MIESKAHPTPTPARAQKLVIPRWIQLVMLPLTMVAAWIVAIKASGLVVLFVIGALIALLLNPLIGWISHKGVPRGIVIAFVYLAFLTVIFFAFFLAINLAADQISSISKSLPSLTRSVQHGVENFQRWLDSHSIDVRVVGTSNDLLHQLERTVVSNSSNIASFTGGIVQKVGDTLFHIFIIFIVSIYMLVYGPNMAANLRKKLPPAKTKDHDLPHRMQRSVSNYVLAQLALSTAMAAMAGLGLWIFGLTGIFPEGKTYALLFAAWVFLMEFVPYIGAWIGALPAMIVALFTDPVAAVYIAILFFVLIELEGHLLAPMIFGKTLRINPLLVIFALLLGSIVYGILGTLLAVPILAMGREIVRYFLDNSVLESWSQPLKM